MAASEENSPPRKVRKGHNKPHTEEAKAKMSEGHKRFWERYKQTDEFQKLRQKHSETMKEAWKNKEHNKLGKRARQKFSEEGRNRMREARKRYLQRVHKALKLLEEMEGKAIN
ncbi:MAG TPA: hypothetical protein VKU94_02935 [Geobacterales bacterium]|nr:hypothetical protein [Geobacterales bacterium]